MCSCSLTDLWSLLQLDIDDQLALGGAESESGKVAAKWGAGGIKHVCADNLNYLNVSS